MEELGRPFLIKSAKEGQRFREQIRPDRGQIKRSAAETIALSEALLKKTKTILIRVGRIVE